MCGGIVGAVSAPWSNKNASWVFHLAYNSGRIASYGAAGALVGGLGSAGLLFRDAVPLQQAFLLVASLMLLGVGLYLAGVARLEEEVLYPAAILVGEYLKLKLGE